MNPTKAELYHYLNAEEVGHKTREAYLEGEILGSDTISQEAWDFFYKNRKKIDKVCIGFGMSEHHLGGDNMVDLADSVARAAKKGFEIVTWYGPETEVLIAGVKDYTPSQWSQIIRED